ncbi:8-oxoguanine glycosylase ogg1 [Mortierella polycephala]|uniref:DNA-(apurinic or apyrimidinic site) lyase n=1 Tax=Mortierella polycephala TaxID=41804 RepID=A0A9P6Q160_9FUNG|nr:8-oxoguanine glycosylase ogg1 [Mortierella polycephala]
MSQNVPVISRTKAAAVAKPIGSRTVTKDSVSRTKSASPTHVRSMPWVSLRIPRSELDLSTTLKCGQSFRWHREHRECSSGVISPPTWSCVLDHRLWCLRETEDGIQFKTFRPLPTPPSADKLVALDKDESSQWMDQDKEFLRDYFQLDVPLTELYTKWSKADANFKTKAPLFPGVRILRQDPVENLVCFICSSNNNIGRISQMALKLCQEYGPAFTIPGEEPEDPSRTFYGFPIMDVLAEDGVEETLRKLGFGYRAKYIANTAKMIKAMKDGESWLRGLRTLSYEEAHSSLLMLQGVGPKVADCVCLMSLDKHNAIPVDTHVWQIAVRDYQFRFDGKVPKTISPAVYKAVGKHFVDLFGAYSGWAHSVLFAADLRSIEGRVKEDPDANVVKESAMETTVGSTVLIKQEVIIEQEIVVKQEEEEGGLVSQESSIVSQNMSAIKLEDSSEPPIKIAVAQFCGGPSVSVNLATCVRLMHQASSLAAKMIFLPEASDFIGIPIDEALTLAHPLPSGLFLEGLCAEAKKIGIWCSVGIHEQSPLSGRLHNTHVLINDQGLIVESYRKIHLFDVDILNGPRLMESDSTVAGDRLVSPVMTPAGKIGLGICYDLRFPELALRLRKAGAEVLTYPSAFTVKTGQAHWEVLLRSRAIETQSYVVAAAQVGQHSSTRTSYGHAMIVDPWGQIVAECDGQAEGVAVAPIELSVLERIRTEMPVMNHRRYDIFP